MIWLQFLLLAGVLLTLVLILGKFIKSFKTPIKTFYSLFIILLLFTIGFAMRLANNQNLIDSGYYLTEISYLFVYILFTIALILGQKKYWKIKN